MPRSTCGNCKKIFNSTPAFEKHRTGNYSEAIYAENDTKQKNPIGYLAPTRRCMTTEEMLAIGLSFERKTITVIHEGQDFKEEHDVWFDVEAREQARLHFGAKSKDEEEDDG